MAEKAIGVVMVSLSATSAEDAAWIKIAPRGRVDTRSGRAFEFHPEGLAAKFTEQGVRIPIDFDHGIARLAAQGHRVDAVGWIEEMEARSDGLYGRVDWLEPGRAALAARTHRYVSPTFFNDSEGRATGMHSVALVTAPDLSNMPALADASGSVATPHVPASVLAALSLPATATETDVLAKVAELQAGVAGAETVPALLSALSDATSARKRERVADKVDAALQAGSLPPYMREWALKNCAADEAGFEKLITAIGTPQAYLQKEMPEFAAMDASGWLAPNSAADEHVANVAARLGIDPKRLKEGKS